MPQRDPGVYLKDISILPLRHRCNITIAHAPQLLLAVQEALKAFPDPPSPL
jgi:hypothetical protein